MRREACFISKEKLQTSQNYLYTIQLFEVTKVAIHLPSYCFC